MFFSSLALVAALASTALASAVPPSFGNLQARGTTGLKCPSNFTTYTVQSGDMGYNISVTKQVSTLTFLNLPENHLKPPMYPLTAGQQLCVPPSCPGYLVQQGDSCEKIASMIQAPANGDQLSAFYGYNPSIENPGCTPLNYGTWVCLGKPDGTNHPQPGLPNGGD